ncbi:MAG: NUDIX domain-containing protein [Gemmatimonadaceae bacterium]|nr:NUDIX domain-containing protein [Gemmatimonadaceae bacterium]
MNADADLDEALAILRKGEPAPLYVHRPVANGEEIVAWAKSVGFETTLPAEKLHVTVVYSKAPVDGERAGDHFDRLYLKGGKRSVERLGDGGAVVLKIESAELTKRWEAFRAVGASWDYAGYQPHVTITWDAPAEMDLAALPVFEGDIVLGPEVFEPLDEDWKASIVEKANRWPANSPDSKGGQFAPKTAGATAPGAASGTIIATGQALEAKLWGKGSDKLTSEGRNQARIAYNKLRAKMGMEMLFSWGEFPSKSFTTAFGMPGQSSAPPAPPPKSPESQKVLGSQFGGKTAGTIEGWKQGFSSGSAWSAKPPPGAVPHPKVDDKGKPVTVNYPSNPSPESTWKDPDAVATFTPGSKAPASLHGVPLRRWAPPDSIEGWKNVAGQKPGLEGDTPMATKATSWTDKDGKTFTSTKHVGAGVIVEEPDGRVWVVKPTNRFGGYDATFPKGTVEDGLSLQASAIKETYEESGLKVEITGILGDYERTTSVARYYTAKRVGGTPTDMGWESQAVKLVPRAKLAAELNMAVDREIADQYDAEVAPPKKVSKSYTVDQALDLLVSLPPGWSVELAQDMTTLEAVDTLGARYSLVEAREIRKAADAFMALMTTISKAWEQQPRWPGGTPLGGQWKAYDAAGMTLPPKIDTGKTGVVWHAQAFSTAYAMAQSKAVTDLEAMATTFSGKYAAQKMPFHKKLYGAVAQYANDLIGFLKAAPAANAAADKAVGPFVLKDLTKVGPKPGGSSQGGMYEDANGQKWIVKSYPTAGMAQNEVLAANLYAACGLPVPEMRLVDLGGQYHGGMGVASKVIDEPLAKIDLKNKAQMSAAQAGFAAHAALANWDTVGMSFDNLMIGTKTGKAYMVDPGGSLEFRAMGEPKGEAFGTKVGEITTLRDPKKNAQAAAVFGAMDADALAKSAQVIKPLLEGDTIAKLVDAYADHKGPQAKDALAAKLRLRVKDAIKTLEGMAAGKPAPVAPDPPATGPVGAEALLDTAALVKPGSNLGSALDLVNFKKHEGTSIGSYKSLGEGYSKSVDSVLTLINGESAKGIAEVVKATFMYGVPGGKAAGVMVGLNAWAYQLGNETGKPVPGIPGMAGDGIKNFVNGTDEGVAKFKKKMIETAAASVAPAMDAYAKGDLAQTVKHFGEARTKLMALVSPEGMDVFGLAHKDVNVEAKLKGAISSAFTSTIMGMAAAHGVDTAALMAGQNPVAQAIGATEGAAADALAKPTRLGVPAKDITASDPATTMSGPMATHVAALQAIKFADISSEFYGKLTGKMVAAAQAGDLAAMKALAPDTGKKGNWKTNTPGGKKLAPVYAAMVAQMESDAAAKTAAEAAAKVEPPKPGTSATPGHAAMPSPMEYFQPPKGFFSAKHNSKLAHIHQLGQAGNVEAILAMDYPGAWIGKQQAAYANKVLAALGSTARVKDSTIAQSHVALAGKHVPIPAMKGHWTDMLADAGPATMATIAPAGVAAKIKHDPSALPMTGVKLPDKMNFMTMNGGKPLSSKPHVNQQNVDVQDAMFAAAMAGNLTALKDLKYDVIDKETGAKTGVQKPVSEHPSHHITETHNALVQALDEVANPPEPLKQFSGSAIKSMADMHALFPAKKFTEKAALVPKNQQLGYWAVLGVVDNPAVVDPPKTFDIKEDFKQMGYTKWGQLSSDAKSFSQHIQSSGSFNDAIRNGQAMYGSTNVKKVALAAINESPEIPEGMKMYRWQNIPAGMLTKLQTLQPGAVIDAMGSMCTSYHPTATKGFGPANRIVITAAKGAKAALSFGSGAFSGEKEITTLPGVRYVFKGMKKNPGGWNEIELVMLPPDPKYLDTLK